jgi:hypothetical protein
MGLTLAHPAHSNVRAREVRVSVHCEPLPSRCDASLPPQCAALGFESAAAARFEYCAVSAPREAAYLRCARGTHRSMLSSAAWLRGTCVLRALRQS